MPIWGLMKMLEVKDLRATYGKHPALHGVSLHVKPGEIVVILGANGAGKSTLLKSIAGICEGRVTGTVEIAGERLLGLPPHKVVEQGVALVPEGRGIFGDLNVRDNLMLGANPDRAREDHAQVYDRLIRLFPKLEERASQIARTMSGGEQQMVAIGRAMMSNPVILMLDEPSLGLSPLLSKELFQNLKAVREAGLGILLVEQNAKLSLGIADRGYLLENGEILREDRADILRNDPAVQAAYLGGGGGKAAPRPRDVGAPGAKPAAPVAEAQRPAAPSHAPVTARKTSARSVSASTVAGLDINALVARAGERPAGASPARVSTPARPAPTALPPDRLRETLARIEDAARQCRAPSRSTLPPLRASVRERLNTRPATEADDTPVPSGSAPAPAPASPAPQGKVEVWRCRPGSSQFDKER